MFHRLRNEVIRVLLAFVVMAVFGAVPAEAGPQVIVIDAFPTPTAAGNALYITLVNITDASAAKPYLIRMEPGLYDIGTTRLQLKPFVDIEGSGQANTIIQGYGNSNSSQTTGVLLGANSMEIRNLQIRCLGAAGQTAIALYNGLASPTLRAVTITTSGGSANWGIRNQGASPFIEDTTITVTGGQVSYGIVNTSFTPSRPTLRRTNILSTGAATSTGIYNDQASMPAELRDVRIVATGTSVSYGFYCADTGGASSNGIVTGSLIVAAAASGTNYGVYFDGGGGSASLTLQQSEVRANGGTSSYGVRALSGILMVRHSRLFGTTASLYATTAVPPVVVFTQLDGPVL